MADDKNDEITLHLTITGSQGAPRVPVKVSKTVTSTELRKLVCDATKIDSSTLRLIYRGRLISDDPTKKAVDEFKLEDGSVLHCMGKPTAQQQQQQDSAAAGSTSTTAAAAASPAAAPAGSTVTIPGISPAPMAAVVGAIGAPSAGVPSFAGTAVGDPVSIALRNLWTSNSPSVYQTAVSTLEKILSNIIQNPMEDKYRRVKKQNAAFQKRLGGLPGGDAAMKAAGFVAETDNGEEVYMMHASADAWPHLVKAQETVTAAVAEAKRVNATAAAAAAPTSAAGTGGAGAFPPFGAAAGVAGTGAMPGLGNLPAGFVPPPQMQAAMANLLSDPNALQSMLQNPMVQNMIRNDPRMANNPMMQRAMEEVATNPDAANQVSQMLRDPNMVRMMQAMQQQQGGVGGLAPMNPFMMGQPQAGATGATGASSTQRQQPSGGNNNNSQQQQGQSDEDMTEEEMIAEAIRRSLQDN